MNPADKLAAKTGDAAGSDEQLDPQLRAILENLQQVTKEDEPVERDDLSPGIAPAQMEQMAQSLAALRETVAQIAASEDQTSREIARLESAVAELILKIPEPSAQPPAAATRKPMPVPPSSRAPTALQPSRTPIPPRQ